MKHPYLVKDLPVNERPREKLIQYGPEKLTEAELLAILLRTGKKGESVLSLSKKILTKFNQRSLIEVSFSELAEMNGLGPAKACEIIACFELGRRLLKDKKVNVILTPEDVWNELRDYRGKKKEHFFVFYLDTRNQEIKREIISVGTLNASLVHPREVFEPAIKNICSSIIVAHNHPSGIPEPSQDDLEVTKRLTEAGKLLGIELIDHVIVCKEGYFSFKENNRL